MRLPLITIISAMFLAGSVLADHHEGDMHPAMGSPEHPTVILGPPEGFEPPEDMAEMPEDPDEAKRMALEMFFHFMDGSGNGELDWDEFTAWVRHFAMPEMGEHMGEPMGDHGEEGGDHMGEHPDGGKHMDEHMEEHPEEGEHMMMELREGDEDVAHLPRAPECSDELRDSELGPQEEGHPCRDREGNLVFRTICNMPGFESAAISLPGGRAAGCFGIEALSGGIAFEIVTEDGGPIWDMSMGPESYKGLKLEEGIYHINSIGGDPEGAITIRFVDVATDM